MSLKDKKSNPPKVWENHPPSPPPLPMAHSQGRRSHGKHLFIEGDAFCRLVCVSFCCTCRSHVTSPSCISIVANSYWDLGKRDGNGGVLTYFLWVFPVIVGVCNGVVLLGLCVLVLDCVTWGFSFVERWLSMMITGLDLNWMVYLVYGKINLHITSRFLCLLCAVWCSGSVLVWQSCWRAFESRTAIGR